MISKFKIKRQLLPVLFTLAVLFNSCKKADNFNAQLNDLPQISNEVQYQYRAAYGVGDTLTITGLLHPEKQLKVTVGGIEAPVVKTAQVKYVLTTGSESGLLDQVSVIITEAMGIGASRTVSVSSGGNVIDGASIEIFALGGEGSFASPLKMTAHYMPDTRQNVYLNCINGRGDIYYFGFADNALYHIKKDGSRDILLKAAELQIDQNGPFTLSTFIAGGVNPQGTQAWISVQSPTGTRFCQVDLAAKKVTTLSQASVIRAPYEGDIATLNTTISGVYPDSKGNVYVLVGPVVNTPEYTAQAIAKFTVADRSLKYIFKTVRAAADMPGTGFGLTQENQGISVRFYPEEASMYLFSNRTVSTGGQAINVTGITAYNLNSGVKTGEFAPNNVNFQYARSLGPFNAVRIAFDFGLTNNFQPQAGVNFGFLPMPGNRLQFLLYQVAPRTTSNEAVSGFPKWEVIDFKNQRLYQYAPGTCDLGNYTFGPISGGSSRIDQILNYDQEGHLYTTANGKTAIVKTAIQ